MCGFGEWVSAEAESEVCVVEWVDRCKVLSSLRCGRRSEEGDRRVSGFSLIGVIRGRRLRIV